MSNVYHQRLNVARQILPTFWAHDGGLLLVIYILRTSRAYKLAISACWLESS